MLRLSAKIDTSVPNAITCSTAIDPRIAIPPTAIGNAAASSPLNTQINTMKLSGTAIASTSSKSRCDSSVICRFTVASPPERTVTPSRSCATSSDSVSAYFCALFFPPVMPATISPHLPSLLTRSVAASGGTVHAEATLGTWGDRLS